MAILRNLVGLQFSRLRVLSIGVPSYDKSGNKQHRWICVCDCGNFCQIFGKNLKKGTTGSCGCYRKEATTKHSMCRTPTYYSWSGMLQRCTNPLNTKYSTYGGDGVKVCERWLESFENFYEDMGERPAGTSLNRVNGVKFYSKETCSWADLSLQVFDTKIFKTNTSGKTGVSWSSSKNKWESYIHVNGKRINLGQHEDFSVAVGKREEAEIKYFGFLKDELNVGNQE